MLIRNGLTCVCVVATATLTFAQGPSIAWQNLFDGASQFTDWSQSVVVAPSGQIYVGGTTFEEESPGAGVFVPRMLTMSITPNGVTTWSRVFGLGFYGGNGSVSKIGLQPSGRVVVAGAKDVGQDWIVAGYETNGTLAWSGVWDANSWFMSQPSDMAIDAAGNIYLCGDYGDPSLGSVGGIAKFGPDGQLLWGRALDTASEVNSVRGLGLDAAGNVYVTGTLYVAGGGDRFAVVKLDGAGVNVWTRTHGVVDPSASSIGLDVAVDVNGRVLAAGHGSAASLTDTDILAVAYDAQGNLLWHSEFGSAAGASDFADTVTFDAQGRIFVGGSTLSPSFDRDALIVAFSPGGAIAWSSVRVNPLDDEQPLTISTDSNGTALVAGLTISATGWTGFARLFTAGGSLAGDFSFGPTDGSTFLQGSAVAASNRWYVVGQHALANSYSDALTVAIDHASTSSYCTAGTSVLGCSASLTSTGTASASASSGFVLSAAGLDGQRQGLIFYGISGRLAQAWGTTSSILCVKPPTQRTIAANAGGTLLTCTGSIAVDWNHFVATTPALGTPFQAGAAVQAQAWYRDPASSKTTALSDALEFFVQP